MKQNKNNNKYWIVVVCQQLKGGLGLCYKPDIRKNHFMHLSSIGHICSKLFRFVKRINTILYNSKRRKEMFFSIHSYMLYAIKNNFVQRNMHSHDKTDSISIHINKKNQTWSSNFSSKITGAWPAAPASSMNMHFF